MIGEYLIRFWKLSNQTPSWKNNAEKGKGGIKGYKFKGRPGARVKGAIWNTAEYFCLHTPIPMDFCLQKGTARQDQVTAGPGNSASSWEYLH